MNPATTTTTTTTTKIYKKNKNKTANHFIPSFTVHKKQT